MSRCTSISPDGNHRCGYDADHAGQHKSGFGGSWADPRPSPTPRTTAAPANTRPQCTHDSTRADGWLDTHCLRCGVDGYWERGNRAGDIEVHPSGKVLLRVFASSPLPAGGLSEEYKLAPLNDERFAALIAMPDHERLACLLCGGLAPGEASGSADLCVHPHGPLSVAWLLGEIACAHRQARLASAPNQTCRHEWIDVSNEAVISGEMCKKCGAVRPAPNREEGE